jgi:hypothetical protein
MGWVVNATPRPLYPRERDQVPIVQEAGWAPGPIWTGAENLPTPPFDPRTVQPVASRYTDWAVINLHINRRGEILCVMEIETRQKYVATVKVFRLRNSHYQGVDVIYVTNLNNTKVVWPSVKFCLCNAVQATGRTDMRTCWYNDHI